MINNNFSNKGYSQRQLRVGELVKVKYRRNYSLKMRQRYHHLIQDL